MKAVLGVAMLLLPAGLCGVLAAEASTEVAAAGNASGLEELDEVLVKGTRLYELRAAMVAAEDKFFARYNELNKKDEFDIECHAEKRTGTFLFARRCYPRAVSIATRAEGLAFVEAVQSPPEQRRLKATPASVVLTAKVEDYQDNMLALLKRHPELRRLVRQREKLEEQYERLRKAR